jgi:TPP-dependent 2-oxoacid decarboxylase
MPKLVNSSPKYRLHRASGQAVVMVLIECALDRDDCTAELLEWESRVAAANARRQPAGCEFAAEAAVTGRC